jgi:DNA-binding NarL/FixJ family response regulator
MIRLAIAEERAVVRWALREAFENVSDMEVVGDAGTVDDVLAMIERVKPDVLLLDMMLRDHLGYELIERIRDLEAGPLVLMMSPYDEPTFGVRAITAGAHGYVGKSAEPTQVFEAIRAISRGERAIPAGVEAMLQAGDGHPAAALTRREMQVMEMIARGLTNREIARDLDISVKTIDTHRGHVLKKLALRNNAELARFAVRHGYISV